MTRYVVLHFPPPSYFHLSLSHLLPASALVGCQSELRLHSSAVAEERQRDMEEGRMILGCIEPLHDTHTWRKALTAKLST